MTMDFVEIVNKVIPTTETGKSSYLSKDPELLLSLIDKYVKVQLIEDLSFSGFVHAIDPITHSVLISVPRDDLFQRTIIPGHAVINISKIPPQNIRPPIQRVSAAKTDQHNISHRKAKIIAWFKWNLLPVSEVGSKIIVKNINILPPYKVSDIYAENPAIALQIRKVMENMPQDFVPQPNGVGK